MEQFTNDKICKYCSGCKQNARESFKGYRTASCFRLAVDKQEFMKKYYGKNIKEN